MKENVMSNEAWRTFDCFVMADCVWEPMSSGASSVIGKTELRI
jgi:hypothetical protein